jgi:hypothetical protein
MKASTLLKYTVDLDYKPVEIFIALRTLKQSIRPCWFANFLFLSSIHLIAALLAAPVSLAS